MKDKWIVDIKGGPNESPFEISVVRESNKHGRESFGWFGPDKHLISHNGGPCNDHVQAYVWNRLVSLAQQFARELNRAEENA